MNEKKVIKAIQDGKTKEAILALKEFNLSKQKETTLSVIEAEFNTLNQEVLKGTIDNEQKQLRLNRVNDKLLNFLSTKDTTSTNKGKRKTLLTLLVSITIVLLFFLYQAINSNTSSCPKFNGTSKNNILLIPFENVGSKVSKPHLLLRDRIEELSINKNLSTSIKLGEAKEGLTIKEAPKVAQSCGANVIIWGKYSNSSDSLRLILQYYFLEQPDWSKMTDLIVLKDVTSIQKGQMFKDLEDSIISLCSIIALRQDKVALTKEWLKNIKEKNKIDFQILDLIKNMPNKVQNDTRVE